MDRPSSWARVRTRAPLPAALLTVLVAATLLFGRGYADRTLVKSDEALYAAAALQLARGDNPLYPRGEFARYREMGKPPGALWPAALSIKLFGRTKAAVRAPTILAGIVACVLLALIASTLAGSALAGLLAGLLALTQGGWLELGRVIWLENTLTALFLLALWLDHLGRDEPVARRQRWLQVATGLVIGYAAWVKHLVGLAPLAAILVAELVLDPSLLLSPRRLWRRFGWTSVAALGLFAIWVVPFVLDRGTSGALAQIPAKLAADPHTPRKAGDVWLSLSDYSMPWLVVAGGLCLVGLIALALRRDDEDSAAQRALLLACAGLMASHLLVFGEIADKHRPWYFFPILPLLALGPGVVLGRWLGRGESRLAVLGAPLLVAALGMSYGDLRRQHLWLLLGLGALAAGLWTRQALHQLLPVPAGLRVQRWLPVLGRGLALVAAALVLGRGLDRSSERAWKSYGPDTFAEYAAAWEQDPPPRLVVDAQRWGKQLYYQPTVYFYFSPLPIVPVPLDPPCDTSALPAGEYVLIHHTKVDCVAPRARQLRELSQWWRMVRLH